MRTLIAGILLSLAILLPIGKKCEIRIQTSLALALIVGVLTGFSTLIISRGKWPFALTLCIELCFLVLFTGIIGLYRFYRDPKRVSPDKEKLILAPADGFIRYIRHSPENGWTIGITMTYLDVHVVRSPVDGIIKSIKKKGDKFLSLKKESAPRLNKQVQMLIDSGEFQIGLSLIASRLVRKILVWVKEQQEVKKGVRIGKIVFGSQTDIIIPHLLGLKIRVKEKEQVYAGLTILAEYELKGKTTL